MLPNRLFAMTLTIVVAVGVLAMPRPVASAACNLGECHVTITTSLWTGQPTLQCSIEDVVVKVVVNVSCPGCTSTQTFYRCGASSDPHQFTVCGRTHTVSLAAGHTWEGALSSCEGIVYDS